MIIKKKMLFILIGNDRTGKTTIQKMLAKKLCGVNYEKLPVNKGLKINHSEIKRKYNKVSFGNRSYQELKKEKYKSVDLYFEQFFNNQKIAFISSHLNINDINLMIKYGKSNFFDVYGIFFTNSIDSNFLLNSEISQLNWDERFVIENPVVEKPMIDFQLNEVSDNIVKLLINKTSIS